MAAKTWRLPAWPVRLPWVGRRLSSDEQREYAAARQELAEARRLKEILQTEAVRYARAIRRTLTRYGVRKDLRDEQGRFTREVQFFQPYVMTEEAIKIKVNTSNLPDGVTLKDLRDQDILDLLSVNCERRVTYRYHERRGFWFVIERHEGYGVVPGHVNYQDMIEARPATLGPYAIPVGKSENRSAKWLNIPSAPHILVAGSTGGGKSNFEHVILTTLIQQCTPAQLQLWMIDLKGGVELQDYANLPHVGRIEFLLVERRRSASNTRRARGASVPADDPNLPPALTAADDETEEVVSIDPDKLEDIKSEYRVTYRSEKRPAIVKSRRFVLGLLYAAEVEAERRMGLFAALPGVRNISDYNSRRPDNPLPRIFLVCDEIASLMRDPSLSDEAEFLVEDLANRARAMGIHLLFFTQTPEANVLTPSIRNAFPVKVVFGMANQHMSVSLVGNQRAAEITRPGRAIYLHGKRQTELQTPYAPPELVLEYLAAAAGGETVTRRQAHDIYPAEIYGWALRERKGYLVADDVWNEFKARGLTQREAAEFVRAAIGQRVVADEQVCIVQPPAGHFPNRIPARLLPWRPQTAAAAAAAPADDPGASPAPADDPNPPPALF